MIREEKAKIMLNKICVDFLKKRQYNKIKVKESQSQHDVPGRGGGRYEI